MMQALTKNIPVLLATIGVIGCLIAASYHGLQQYQEDQSIQEYLEQHDLADLPANRSSAISISQQIRRDFNVDESSFQVLNIDDRPFLRHDSEFLLTHLEGTCGQGTRVLINLLSQSGFKDVTRLTMYDRFLNPSHTLVSVRLPDGEEFLVDSINTRDWFNDFINTNTVSVNDFPIIPYTDSDSARSALTKKFREIEQTSPERQKFHNRFWLYSFESTPISKLTAKLGINVLSFQLDRPTPFVSKLAERPHQIIMFVWLGLALGLAVVTCAILGIRKLLLLRGGTPN